MINLLYSIFCVAIAMIGYEIHGSIAWAIVDFFFAPIALIKWLICHEINLEVLESTFCFFFETTKKTE